MSFLRIKVIFLALYCHSPTFAVNDIAKFVNTCFTFISYHIWPRHLQFRCTKAVRRYLKRPPFFWGGHRFLRGPPVAWGATGGPWRKKTSLYIYIYMQCMKFAMCLLTEGWFYSANLWAKISSFQQKMCDESGRKDTQAYLLFMAKYTELEKAHLITDSE